MVNVGQKKWETYEQVAQYLLNTMADQFDLARVEEKQNVLGSKTGASYEIDAKGIVLGGEGFVLIECRRYTTSRQKQEHIAALAYKIIDSGGKGGIIVSPLGLQQGAEKIAHAENIVSVLLDEKSTTKNYILKFLNKSFLGINDEVSVSDHIEYIPPLKPSQQRVSN
jgi:hypothetical protein